MERNSHLPFLSLLTQLISPREPSSPTDSSQAILFRRRLSRLGSLLSAMSAPRGSPSPSRASTVKPGGNWKALKKTLDADSPIGETARRRSAIKHRRPSTSDSTRDNGPYPSSAIHKGKARAIDRGDSSRLSSANSSPAPTSLPWFAEDLSPEDLALVRGGRSNDRRRASTDADRRKKQTILGDSSITGITQAQKE